MKGADVNARVSGQSAASHRAAAANNLAIVSPSLLALTQPELPLQPASNLVSTTTPSSEATPRERGPRRADELCADRPLALPTEMAAQLQRSLTSIAQSWPKDYLRPTLQFSGAILTASSRIFATPAPASAALPTPSTSALPPAPAARPASTAGELETGAQVAGGALSEVQLRKAEQMVASLQNLLENKAFKAVSALLVRVQSMWRRARRNGIAYSAELSEESVSASRSDRRTRTDSEQSLTT